MAFSHRSLAPNGVRGDEDSDAHPCVMFERPRMILISNALVFTGQGMKQRDVLIDGETVTEVGSVSAPSGASVIDATGMVLGPGLVDLHVHFREPGQEWKENIESGSRAAAVGGFTAVVMMPNTIPAIDSEEIAREMIGVGRASGRLDLAVAGAITAGRSGDSLSEIVGLHRAGVRMFSDDGGCVADRTLLGKAMSLVARLPGAFIAEHAEDVSLTAGGHMHEGAVSAGHGIAGLPARAEVDVVSRDIDLARETGARLHIQHLSASGSVDLVRDAKFEGLPVTAEVTPHHLALTDQALSTLDPNLKMYPPLREASDQLALTEALISGVIDIVATDHAPHAVEDKAVPFEDAPRGVIGLETAMPLVLEALGGDVATMFERMSVTPARLAAFGRQGRPVAPGEPANLVLFDPEGRFTPGEFESKSSNSPFLGQSLQGRVVMTIYEGGIQDEGTMR